LRYPSFLRLRGTNPGSESVAAVAVALPIYHPSVPKEKMAVVIAPRRIIDLKSLSEALR
jgi:hypothetical protein